MKNIVVVFLGIVLSLSAFSQTTGDTIISNNISKLKIKVLYFHITNRCHTCYSIEENLRKTIFENFKPQLDNGIIDLYIVNCEAPENKELAKKYDAYGATLAVTLYENGKEIKSEDLSNWAFQKVNKPEIFISELKDKINEFIK